MPDWAEARRDPIPLPVTGCAAAKVYPGGRPPRFNKHMYSSSSMVGGWWNDPLFAELNRSASPYPYPTATLPLALALALAWRHTCATPFCSRACHFLPFTPFPPPCVLRPPSLLPRPSCHAALTAHPTAAAPQDTGHTAARAAGSRAGQIDLVPDWLLLARQAYVRARPQQPAAAPTVSLPRTASRTRTPTQTQTPNPHTFPLPEPGTASCALFRSSSGASLRSRTCQPQTGCCEHSEPRGLSVSAFCPRGHRPEGACRYWYTPERHPWGVWAGWLVRRVVHVSINTV